LLAVVAENHRDVGGSASGAGEGIEVFGIQDLADGIRFEVQEQLGRQVKQDSVMFVGRSGHFDQLPLVEFVALVFLERVVVELLGYQEDFRGGRAHMVQFTAYDDGDFAASTLQQIRKLAVG
jgi:hypothetical protein